MRAVISLLVGLFVACAAPVPPRAEFAGFGEDVPAETVQAAVDEVSACLGRGCDLRGWEFSFAAEEDAKGYFACPQASFCGERPPGCTSDDQCPCRCRGLSLMRQKHVIVTRALTALKHEIIHACTGDADHVGPEWACQ